MRAKRYCESCGTAMTKYIVPLNKFDPDTGKREINVKLTCPNYRWYKLGHWGVTITSTYETKEG